MYAHHIRDMANIVAEKLNVSADAAERALTDYWVDKIALTWSTEDIIGLAAGNFDAVVTEEEAQEVLEICLRRHDASIGMNWDVIGVHLDWFLEQRD